MADAYRSIAIVQKTHGRKGEVVVVPTHGLPLLLHEGLVVVAVPPALKGPREYVVGRCSGEHGAQLVALRGVSTLGQAAKLVGKTLLARVADLPADLGLHDVDALLGRDVEDEELGPLGQIAEVLRGPANDVWVVKGAFGEVLVPAVEPIVRSWEQGFAIRVSLPSGLVEGAPEGAPAKKGGERR